MAELKKQYQCLVCNKVHDTEEAARNCHKGPIQGITKGHTDYDKYIFGAH